MRWSIDQEKAFLEAFDKHADALYRHCFFRVSDPETARDIVSETFTRTWDYLTKGKTVQDFRPFLYRTLNHLIIDEYRKRSTESLDALLEDFEVPESAFEELVGGGRDELEFSIDAKQVTSLLGDIPSQYRDVVIMRYMDELTPAEIADITGLPVNTVSVRIHRGVALLIKQAQERKL